MKLQTISAALFGALLFTSCKEGAKKDPPPVDVQELTKNQTETHGTEMKEGDITLKCQSCHKLTAEKLVGPGWLEVTKRRQPLWIMNMITNVDMMLDTDAEAQKLLEQCMVRMPNQNITQDQAREILEYMRSNDGEK